jgi:ubiquinone/menaquinone biosynthesis C-methylase UbiE
MSGMNRATVLQLQSAGEELHDDTARWLDPRPGERWLDLGCGDGERMAVIWRKSQGRVAEIVGLDAAPAHEEALRQRSELLHPAPKTNQIRFALGNLNSGLPSFPDASFDGIVCNLALAFAESKDAKTGRYTDAAYNRVLSDCRRVLGPGGRFVFSVHVPDPRVWPVFRQELGAAAPAKALLDALQMQRYHRWLRREARRGRFHFFTLPEIVARLRQAGFAEWKSRLSYAGQVYVICALAEAAASRRAA